MQIEVKLKCLDQESISHDYLYSMSSMLKKILYKVTPDFSTELHEGVHKNKLKLFTFSPLSSSPGPKLVSVEGEKRKKMLLGQRCWFRISSPWPELLNALGQGLMTNLEIRIMSKKFKIETINMIAPPEMKESMVWRSFGQSASICTTWSSKETNNKHFIYPDKAREGSPDCATLLQTNIYHKFQRLSEIRADITQAWLRSSGIRSNDLKAEDIKIEYLAHSDTLPYKTLVHMGKNGFIRSWRCPVKVTAPIPIQKLIWATGLGSMNSQGYGLIQEGKNVN